MTHQDRRTFMKTAAAASAGFALAGAANAREGSAMNENQKLRKVVGIRPPPARHWVGDGFSVRTMVSYAEDAAAISPFLLLDYAPPGQFGPSERRRGVGEHPHRGFETVTIAYQGEVEHRDSAGNRGRIGPGDVQWMTAAGGVVHEEMHGAAFSRDGGVFEMAQIWVNLPAKHKMAAPGYQDVVSTRIPEARLPGDAGSVRVIAGECLNVRGPARTFTPVAMWNVSLARGGKAELAMPRGHTVLLLARRNAVVISGGTRLDEGHLAILDRMGEAFTIAADAAAEVLVLGGEPIAEPVVGQGPFVMNTRAEIEQAFDDYRRGRMGRLGG